jgi:carbonic anhydrase
MNKAPERIFHGVTSRSQDGLSMLSATDALERLMEGNARFVQGQARAYSTNPIELARLGAGQEPFAAILGCSDSRVPPELVFDQGLGDLFIVRVAGNVVATEILGSLGYALEHLRVPLIVVLGHEGCGAVRAALKTKFNGITERGKIAELVQVILPALDGIDSDDSTDVPMRVAVEANVRWSVQQLAQTPAGREALNEKRVRLVGAVYELATGRVHFLPEKISYQ